MKDPLHLDTHVVAWLYAGLIHQLSESAQKRLEQHPLFVSPAVELELAHWFDRGIVLVSAPDVLSDLERRIGLEVCTSRFDRLVTLSHTYGWAVDLFDRLICADAALHDAQLLTKDARLHGHFPRAVW